MSRENFQSQLFFPRSRQRNRLLRRRLLVDRPSASPPLSTRTVQWLDSCLPAGRPAGLSRRRRGLDKPVTGLRCGRAREAISERAPLSNPEREKKTLCFSSHSEHSWNDSPCLFPFTEARSRVSKRSLNSFTASMNDRRCPSGVCRSFPLSRYRDIILKKANTAIQSSDENGFQETLFLSSLSLSLCHSRSRSAARARFFETENATADQGAFSTAKKSMRPPILSEHDLKLF